MQLKKGDKIVVWAPSSPGPILFPKRFARAIKSLKDQGYNIVVGDSCKSNIVYNNNFSQRLADEFHKYLVSDEIKGIIFAVGGWTTITLLPHIDWDLVRNNPKLIVGYSDATALLLSIYSKTGMKTIHGPMVIPEWGEYGGPWDYSKDNLEKILFYGEKYVDLHPPQNWTQEVLWWDKEDHRKRLSSGKSSWKVFREGTCEGYLVGGNLSILSLLLGTEYIPSFNGHILFIETEGYSPDKFLAYLTQLKLHNVLDDISGLIVGRHSKPISSSSGSESFEQILEYIFKGIDIPIFLDVDLGHTEPMITLPIGGKIKLDTSKNLLRIFN